MAMKLVAGIRTQLSQWDMDLGICPEPPDSHTLKAGSQEVKMPWKERPYGRRPGAL